MDNKQSSGNNPDVNSAPPKKPTLEFYGGRWVTFVPLLFSLVLLFYIALKNGNVPVYWAAFLIPLLLCLFLAKNKKEYCESILRGIVDPVGGVLIMSIILAGICGTIISRSGMVDTLANFVVSIDFVGNKFVVATFIISCIVGFATGTSVGTIFIVGPILYPVGYLVGGTPAMLIGAIISGGAFGDDLAPISETIIACSSTQKVNLGALFKSRIKYVVPVTLISLVLYYILGARSGAVDGFDGVMGDIRPATLLFLLVPAVIIIACLLQRHLIESLTYGILAGLIIGLVTNIIPLSELISIPEPFAAGGVFVDGINDALPTVVIVMFLFAHINILQEGGGIQMVLEAVEKLVRGPRSAEGVIAGVTMALNIITGLNAAAIMGASPLAYELGERHKVNGYRRSNIMICSGATFNYLMPYMVPVVAGVMISSTYAPVEGATVVSNFDVVFAQFYPWVMLAMTIFAIVTGYGRTFLPDGKGQMDAETEIEAENTSKALPQPESETVSV